MSLLFTCYFQSAVCMIKVETLKVEFDCTIPYVSLQVPTGPSGTTSLCAGITDQSDPW